MGCTSSSTFELQKHDNRDGSGNASNKCQVDLVSACLRMLDFLQEVEEHPCLYTNRRILAEAIRRYETIWLPIVAKSSEKDGQALAAPLDVEWVWHCHMLCPSAGVQGDLNAAQVPFHELLPRQGPAWQEALKRGQLLWEQAAPNEPFDITAQLKQAPLVEDVVGSSNVNSRISYDLAAAAGRQMAFHYQVAVMPHYRDKRFLTIAADRYVGKFLELKRRHPNQFFAPSYDIDCVWHTHQLHPRAYIADTTRLCGSVMDHDDSVNDRSEGSKLTSSWERTQQTWHKEFGDSICQAGGMYRGEFTLQERQLQPQMLAVLRDLPCSGPRWKQEVKITPSWPRNDHMEVPWLHRKDARAAEGSQPGPPSLHRYSRLCDGSASSLAGHVAHGIGAQKQVFSFIEVVAAGNGTTLPIATAHTIGQDQLPREQSVQSASNSPCLRAKELALLLRVGGQDVAVLMGSWEGFQAPVRGVKGIPGDKSSKRKGVKGQKGTTGKPGELKVRLFSLRTGKKCNLAAAGNVLGSATAAMRGIGSVLEGALGMCCGPDSVAAAMSRAKPIMPSLFSFDCSELKIEGVDGKVEVNLADSTIRPLSAALVGPASTAVAYLMALALATLHVSLQPRIQLAEPTSSASLYPGWMVEQRKFPL
ncbi:unnamed protein product [Polarella glacialis]|uniref:Uncharacterized protein n=1 Tax=Polarella glacialis TaxID=89957 RepID=A0A813LGN2_POLGL|nr:unnamed protein product [Polarella glacialis]